jgi:hypothetical protein
MKKICTIIVALLAISEVSNAQMNTPWSLTGPIGIGTTTPTAPLTVQGGGGYDRFSQYFYNAHHKIQYRKSTCRIRSRICIVRQPFIASV